jgi:hypothetical protein
MRDTLDEMAVTVRLKPEVAAEVRRAASNEGLARRSHRKANNLAKKPTA